METDTNRLLEQSASGDQQSFKLLYDNLAPKILAFLMQMLADRHLAEDVLQETMLQSWRKASLFDSSKAKASTWIIAIARNRALDQLRKTGRSSQLLNDNDFQIGQVLHDAGNNVGVELESGRTSLRLDHCLDKLGDDPQVCIRLAYVNGFSFGEIASVRDNSINTVKSWIRRGLEKLGECMQQ